MDLNLLRLSLVLVWFAAAATSLWELDGQSMRLLASAGIDQPAKAHMLIQSGALVDAALGLAMWMRPNRKVYLTALATMVIMTAVATALAPNLWLHPLGPLVKNIPIAAILWLLAKSNQ